MYLTSFLISDVLRCTFIHYEISSALQLREAKLNWIFENFLSASPACWGREKADRHGEADIAPRKYPFSFELLLAKDTASQSEDVCVLNVRQLSKHFLKEIIIVIFVYLISSCDYHG